MNSGNLSQRQLAVMLRRLKLDLHYLDRLTGRMTQKHFPHDDPLFKKAEVARIAMHELCAELDRLRAF